MHKRHIRLEKDLIGQLLRYPDC